MRREILLLLATGLVAGCAPSEGTENGEAPPSEVASGEGEVVSDSKGMPVPDNTTGTRPAGEPASFTVRGTVRQGTECPVLETEDGRRFALSLGSGGDYAPGTRLEVVGEMADASFCMEGEGTIIPDRIVVLEP
ncbi:DUF5818 domain-containing protein [Sphingomicrobium lutaoense]|uniref:Lipoprotein n=1 Tax=Sphingomicrobium lutaoense TaxID=515949 RepID=A0A839YXB0_9SPHN|nr:DUF5818 domain-containing protein [Sphingomicrobium lutaoense]MBB3763676.1 hypothetical protein [Sphingomicrobium lutaoense]